MCHDQRRGGAKLDGKIPVGNRIQRIFANAIEPQFPRNAFPVDRIAGSRQRRRANGNLFARFLQSDNRSASRFSISKYAMR